MADHKAKPPFEKYYSYVLAIFLSYLLANLTVLTFRDKTLPTQAPSIKMQAMNLPPGTARGAFNAVISRNIFNSDGIIPNPMLPQGQTGPSEVAPKDDEPVPSSLPLNLVGTIVISTKPEKSLASIEVKSKNQILAFTPTQDIEGIANLIRVERRKAIIRNLNNNRLEYIEIKGETTLAFGKGKSLTGGEIKKESDNRFSIARGDLLKYTSDLSGILQQARAVPHRSATTGEIDGFTIMDIQSGSVFEKLGLQKLDIITAVNGEPVDSPAKAMELYNALKNSSTIVLGIERGGKKETMNYTITQ